MIKWVILTRLYTPEELTEFPHLKNQFPLGFPLMILTTQAAEKIKSLLSNGPIYRAYTIDPNNNAVTPYSV